MKKSLNLLSLCIIAVSVLSCEKQENHPFQKERENLNQKEVKNVRPTSLVLVPIS